MIRVVTRDDVLTLVVALSRADIELLLEGVPVDLNLAAVHPRFGELVVVVMAGETDEALAAEINGAVGHRLVSRQCHNCGRQIEITEHGVWTLVTDHFTDLSTGEQTDTTSWQSVHAPHCPPAR